LFTNGESYVPFMDKGYQEALAAIEGFSGAQKIWWDILLKMTWSSKLTHPVKQLSSFHPKLFQTDLDSYNQGANAA